jgi:hypothetical protein
MAKTDFNTISFLITINKILVDTIDPYTYNYVYQQLKDKHVSKFDLVQ